MRHILGLVIFVLLLIATFQFATGEEIVSRLEVDSVWSGHRVGFSLLTHAPYQFVAYYNASREMVVASRRLDSEEWRYETLPERVVWDSHNYITMAVDYLERLHVSGNLHVNPLVYFRTREPLEIQSFERVDALVGRKEDRMTYPR
ncbi:MAG: BNR-4 repeat-containing protein, partial [Candidatus Hydrogenedentota bacterium]